MTSNSARASTNPMIGRVLLGRYRVVRELAKGGMGIVYLARSEGAVGFIKPVVVKLILQEYAGDPRFVKMFAREAQILANLRDPGIVDVIEFGEQDGSYVMVLEYVHGYNLGQWRRFLAKASRQVPTEFMLQLTVDVLQALHHAHSARHPDGESMHIVHRDVSPSNVILDVSGRARLLDFGVARMHGGEHGYHTQVSAFVGKDPYIAPEIFAGADASPQSDLYACGVVLHEVLLGHNVFRTKNRAATLQRVMNHLPDPVSAVRDDVPAALDDVLATALAKDPALRFSTALEFADALRALHARSEHEVRADFAAMLQADFDEDLARVLNVESLAERDEAWRRASLDSSGASTELEATVVGLGDRVRPSEHPTAVGPPEEETVVTPGLVGAGGEAVRALEQDAQQQTALERQLRRRMLAGVVLLALTLACTAFIWLFGGRPAANPLPPRIAVVQRPLPTQPPSEQGPAEVDAPALPGELPADEPPPATVEAPKSPKPPRAKAPEKLRAQRKRRSGASLTRAFRRREPLVERCFTEHGVQSAGRARVEIEFTLQADGSVQRAQVLPAQLASTDLGRCVQRVAKGTRFPTQTGPVAFTIPVTARLIK